MESQVAQSWGRIAAWLSETAPETDRQLGAPASAADIAALRTRLDPVVLPVELVELLLLVNGSPGETPLPPPGGELLSTHRIAQTVDMLAGLSSTMSKEARSEWVELLGGWRPEWVPFTGDVQGDNTVIDTRDGDTQGAVLDFLHDDIGGEVLAPSLGAHLMVADNLENGWTPAVIDGHFDWQI